MTSELYPLKFRGTLGGLTTSIAQILIFAAIKTYPDFNRAIGLETTLWIFSVAGFLGTVFALTVLPETRGRSLDQIESEFSSNNSTWSDTKNTIITPPFNVTLQNFTYINDEYPNKMTNGFAYDNLCFNMNLENGKNDLKKSESESKPTNQSNQISSISLDLEHAYL